MTAFVTQDERNEAIEKLHQTQMDVRECLMMSLEYEKTKYRMKEVENKIYLEFIINETIGYGKATHPTLDWATKQDDYEKNIRFILDAYQHDLRFGGNIKTIDYSAIFNSSSEYLYIQNNKTKSIDIFEYVTRLAKLAIRNWDYIDTGITYNQGSTTMTVSSTKDLAVGLFVSSGRGYPAGTKIVSIDSATEITLNNAALWWRRWCSSRNHFTKWHSIYWYFTN